MIVIYFIAQFTDKNVVYLHGCYLQQNFWHVKFSTAVSQYLHSTHIVINRCSSAGAVLVNTISRLTTSPLEVILSQFNLLYLEQTSMSGTMYTGNFIEENTWAIKANQIVEWISLQKLCQECKLLLTWRLIKVVQFFLFFFSTTITFPKGVFRFHHDKGTSLSLLIVSIRWHFSYTGYRPLNVAWSTAVLSNFRIIWSLSSNTRYSRSDNTVIGGAGSFLVTIWPVEYNFIQKNLENVAWRWDATSYRKHFQEFCCEDLKVSGTAVIAW